MSNEKDELAFLIEQATQTQESVTEYRKIVRVALGKWLKNLQNGDIKLETVHDVEVLMKLDLELQKQT